MKSESSAVTEWLPIEYKKTQANLPLADVNLYCFN
jgi:hypothetical protein